MADLNDLDCGIDDKAELTSDTPAGLAAAAPGEANRSGQRRTRLTKPAPCLPCFMGMLAIGLLACLPWRSLAQTTSAPPERYAAAIAALEQFIGHELASKELPALSIALVDDQTIIWAKGFGTSNPRDKI